jgi:hypothetical protein
MQQVLLHSIQVFSPQTSNFLHLSKSSLHLALAFFSNPIHSDRYRFKRIRDPRIHGLRTPREEIAFTARPKIQSQSQIFRYGQSIFCLPHRPNFSGIVDLCLHWVSVVRARIYVSKSQIENCFRCTGFSLDSLSSSIGFMF